MLRFDHMTSDFHPIYLFLGESRDLKALSDFLRQFAGQPRTMSVSDHIPDSKSRTKLSLVPTEHDFGMRAVDDQYEWRLNAWQAGEIADRIDVLTPEENKSGSDIFEVGMEGEIPVKVSRGEFTDDFLVTKL